MADASPAEQDAARRREELRRRVAEMARQEDEVALVEQPLSMHERRVYFIFDMMIEGLFVAGRTPRDMAKLWGLSRSYVQNVSAEASRLYKTFYLSDPEEVELLAMRVRHGFETMAEQARQMAAEHGPYALKVAGELLDKMALYGGARPADKVEHTGKDGAALAPGVMLLPAKAEAVDADG